MTEFQKLVRDLLMSLNQGNTLHAEDRVELAVEQARELMALSEPNKENGVK